MGMLDFMLNEGKGFGANPPLAGKMPVLPQTPAAMADVAAATRAARVAQYGEAAVAAMEKAGGTFGGTTAAPVSGMTAPSAVVRAIPTFARGASAIATGVGAVAPLIAPAVETGRVVSSVMDPSQSAGETGLRTVMGAGRLAGLSLGAKVPGPWWAKALGATAGYLAPDVAESVSRWAQGGSTVTPASTAAPSVGASTAHAIPDRVFTPAPAPDPAPIVSTEPAPFTAADVTGTRIPSPGRGAFVNTRTGQVTNLTSASTPTAEDEAANAMHARGQAVYGVGNGFGAQPNDLGSVMGAAYGAKLRDRAAATKSANEIAQAKILIGAPAAAKAAAEAAALNERIRLASKETDPIKRAAILSGHNPPTDPGVKVTPGMSEGTIITTDPTGKSVLRTARPPLRQADIDESMRKAPKGTTLEQVLQRFRDQQYDTTPFEKKRGPGAVSSAPDTPKAGQTDPNNPNLIWDPRGGWGNGGWRVRPPTTQELETMTPEQLSARYRNAPMY